MTSVLTGPPGVTAGAGRRAGTEPPRPGRQSRVTDSEPVPPVQVPSRRGLPPSLGNSEPGLSRTVPRTRCDRPGTTTTGPA